MRIYVFHEHYPSPFKPYFNTQFEQFLKDKHELRIFALGYHQGELEPKVTQLGLDRLTRYLPTTLHTLPRFAIASIASFAHYPFQWISAAYRIVNRKYCFKHNIINIFRMLQLPLTPPNLCLVHNLMTMRSLLFLRHLYPGVPVAFYYHGGELPGVPKTNFSEAAKAFAASDIVFTNTESSKRQATSRGCPPQKIKVLPVGFNITEFEPDSQRRYRRNGVLSLLSIGRISQEKGFIYGLQAMVELMRQGVSDWNYRIVGSGPLEVQLKTFAESNHLSEKVSFLGMLSRNSIYSELKRADVLLLPSIVVGSCQETQACVVQEAMLMKTLVITTNVGGLPESIAPEMQRFSVPPEDPFSIAEIINNIISLDYSQWQILGQACRKFAVSHYNISHLNSELLQNCVKQKNSDFN